MNLIGRRRAYEKLDPIGQAVSMNFGGKRNHCQGKQKRQPIHDNGWGLRRSGDANQTYRV
jgi:hypothetical protein